MANPARPLAGSGAGAAPGLDGGTGAGAGAAASTRAPASGGGGGGLFGDDGDDDAVPWALATTGGGVRAFRIKNLDSGETSHVSESEKVLEGITTFDSGAAEADAAAAAAASEPYARVLIAGTSPAIDREGRKYTAYSIEVSARTTVPAGRAGAGTTKKWLVQRRFRDFVELEKIVRRTYGTSGRLTGLPALPKKKWFGSLDAKVVAARMADLEAYLAGLIRTFEPDECVHLATFLELGRRHVGAGQSTIGGGTLPAGHGGEWGMASGLKSAETMPDMLSLAEAAERFPEYRGAHLT